MRNPHQAVLLPFMPTPDSKTQGNAWVAAPPPQLGSPSLGSFASSPSLPEPCLHPSPGEQSPGQLPLTWALTGPRPGFQLRFLGASLLPQLRHLRPPVTCPGSAARGAGLAWLRPVGGWGGLTGKGRANHNVRQMKSAGRGGGKRTGREGGVWLPETWAQPGGGVGAGVWGRREEQPPPQALRGEGVKGRFPGQSLQAEIRASGPMGLEQSCEIKGWGLGGVQRSRSNYSSSGHPGPGPHPW